MIARASQLFLPTLRDALSDAEAVVRGESGTRIVPSARGGPAAIAI